MLEVHKTVISVLVIVCKDYLRNLIIAEHIYIYSLPKQIASKGDNWFYNERTTDTQSTFLPTLLTRSPHTQCFLFSLLPVHSPSICLHFPFCMAVYHQSPTHTGTQTNTHTRSFYPTCSTHHQQLYSAASSPWKQVWKKHGDSNA